MGSAGEWRLMFQVLISKCIKHLNRYWYWFVFLYELSLIYRFLVPFLVV